MLSNLFVIPEEPSTEHDPHDRSSQESINYIDAHYTELLGVPTLIDADLNETAAVNNPGTLPLSFSVQDMQSRRALRQLECDLSIFSWPHDVIFSEDGEADGVKDSVLKDVQFKSCILFCNPREILKEFPGTSYPSSHL